MSSSSSDEDDDEFMSISSVEKFPLIICVIEERKIQDSDERRQRGMLDERWEGWYI
jgi:hypothetical protein